MTTPRFSVVIPAHDRWPLVADAVESVLRQTLDGVEVVVVDDGSTDGTPERLRERFPTVTVVTQPNSERGAARNLGMRTARGEHVLFLDSDDCYEPHHCAVVARALDAAPGTVACATRSVLWDPDDGRTWALSLHPEAARLTLHAALWGSPVPIVNLAVRRDIALAAGGFPEDRAVAGTEDWVFVVRLLALHPVLQLDDVTVRIRHHAGRSVADPVGIVRSREAGTALLLEQGLPTGPLDRLQRERLLAGTAYFRAANAYGAGDVRTARRALREVLRRTGPAGPRLVLRLWTLSLLPRRGVRAVRRGRDLVRARA